MDQHGHPAIHDRTRDSITSGGESISSIALENALMAHPTWVERPVAIVAFKEGSSATEQELRDPVVPQFARWWLPAVFVFVPEIPKTSTGKFLKSALREQHPDLLTKRGDSGRSVAD